MSWTKKTFSEEFCKTRNCRPSTGSTNWYNLVRLKRLSAKGDNQKDSLPKSVSWVTGPLIKKVSDMKPTVAKNILSSAVAYLKFSKGPKKITETASKAMYKAAGVVQEFYESRQKTDRQKKNWLKMSEIKGVFKQLGQQVKSRGLDKKEELTGNDSLLYQNLLMIAFHGGVMAPQRNHFADLMFVSRNHAKDEEDTNYIFKGRQGWRILLNDYKTRGRPGKLKPPVELSMKPAMSRLLNRYVNALKLEHGDPVFTTSTGNKLTKNAYSKRLITIFKKYTGKTVGSQLLRNIYVSDKWSSLPVKELRETAHEMVHGLETHLGKYLKK